MRNISIDTHFNQRAARHVPRMRFGETEQSFTAWRRQLLPQVKDLLQKMPERTPLNAQTEFEWCEEGLIKQRVMIDVEPGLSLRAYVFRPKTSDAPRPAILACHGHGEFGKESVMGNRSTPELAQNITAHNYDYGLQMAKAGYVTMAIDWRGFGDRDDRRKPHHHDIAFGGDLCNLHFLRASMFGMTLLGMNLHDASCALDYLCTHPSVDPNRLGVMGLSFGGTMATWISICDERIKASNIICYSDRFSDFAIRDVNFCGSQMVPGLYDLCDVPDLHGLIAPRPLLVEIGIHDECFRIEAAMSCFREVEKIYSAAGAREMLHLDLFAGGHRWGGNRSMEFFNQHL